MVHRQCPWLHLGWSALAVLALLGATASPAAAQYFGRNKVQYKDLEFQILKTEHFDIYFYPTAREGVEMSARMAERWLARLEKQLDHQLRGRQPLVLYASHVDFQQTNTIMGDIGEGTGGVTEALRRRIILPLAGPLADTDHVIGHELVHAFQFDMTTRPDSAPGETGANRLPLWFIEGMAEYLSVGPVDPHTAMWLRDAVRDDKLPTIRDLDNPRYFPYRWGQAFWAYVAGRFGEGVIPRMLVIGAAAGSTEAAIKQVLGVEEKELSSAWQASMRAAYADVLEQATPPNEVGRFVLSEDDLGARMNLGPALSPDGKWIAFLSERSLISVDLYVADTATGKRIRKLTSTATSPHFSSLQFIYSAGSWDAASERIAIATVADGKAAIVVINAMNGDRERTITIDEVDEAFNPTWAPDGRSIAFTGMARGLTDLYVLDVQSGAVRALTSDPWADLQPAWSPDGRRIAFITDRFSSKLDVLDFGPFRLGLIDPATGRVEQVPAFTDGKMINPQWAPDSAGLYFISDRNGVSNLYRVTLDGDVTQMTNVTTGLSGITA
ncbi:MAG: peptidase S9, partial [Vicinamibacterales bacterium]